MTFTNKWGTTTWHAPMVYPKEDCMSDCSTHAYEAQTPIRGQIVWKYGMRPTEFTYSRYVNGKEREIEYIECDGKRYLPAPEYRESCEVMD